MKISRPERAYKYINMCANGGDVADFFEENESVVIYGFTDLARAIYNKICDKVNFIGFIDTKGEGESYKATNVYFLQHRNLIELLGNVNSVRIIVIPTWDYERIVHDCKYWLPCDVKAISVDEIFVYENLKQCKEKYSQSYLDAINDVLLNEKCDKGLYIGGTAYMTLLYMLMKPDWEKDVFVMQNDYTVDLANEMIKRNLPVVLVYDEAVYNTAVTDSVKILVNYFNKHDLEIYGDDLWSARYGIKKENFNVVEDGIANYRYKHCCSVRNRANGDIYYGFDPRIKGVYMTGRLPIPEQIKGREVIVDMMKAWREKSEEEKQLLMDIFSFPQGEIEKLLNDGYDKIFLTDKMTRNNWVTESDQIDMCREVLSKYDKNVIIKPHPADLVDYTKYFPEYPVLYGKFPVDFVGLQQMKIKKIISFFSTACFGNTVFSDEQADMYPEIMERYGIKTVQQELKL